MTNKSRIFIGCGVGILISLLALIGVVGVVVYVVSDSEFIKQNDKVSAEGREFGKTTDQNGCIKKGLSWLGNEKEPTVQQIALNGFFVSECLLSSKPSPGFCKGVPKFFDDDWKSEQCRMVGRNDVVCGVVFTMKKNYCQVEHKPQN